MIKNSRAGFTIPELLIVLTIVGILFSLSTVNLFQAYHGNTLQTTLSTLQADLKQQQLKAMVGDTEGQGTQDDYGVYFASDGNSYILFKGSVYSAADPNNFEVDLNDDLQITNVLVSDRQFVFANKSGEISNFVPNLDRITLTGASSTEVKTLRFNSYGTVIDIF